MAIPKKTVVKNLKVREVGPHWEEHSTISFSVCSSFKADNSITVTTIVRNSLIGNRFWDKHILRKGEAPADVLYMRDALKSGKGDVNFGYQHFGDKVHQGVSASTVVDMNMIDERMMFYRFAYSLAKALRSQKFGASPDQVVHPGRVDLIVDFKVPKCVKSLKYPDKIGAPGKDHSAKPALHEAQAIYVTAVQRSLLVDGKISFEIDHCHYGCEP